MKRTLRRILTILGLTSPGHAHLLPVCGRAHLPPDKPPTHGT